MPDTDNTDLPIDQTSLREAAETLGVTEFVMSSDKTSGACFALGNLCSLDVIQGIEELRFFPRLNEIVAISHKVRSNIPLTSQEEYTKAASQAFLRKVAFIQNKQREHGFSLTLPGVVLESFPSFEEIKTEETRAAICSNIENFLLDIDSRSAANTLQSIILCCKGAYHLVQVWKKNGFYYFYDPNIPDKPIGYPNPRDFLEYLFDTYDPESIKLGCSRQSEDFLLPLIKDLLDCNRAYVSPKAIELIEKVKNLYQIGKRSVSEAYWIIEPIIDKFIDNPRIPEANKINLRKSLNCFKLHEAAKADDRDLLKSAAPFQAPHP